MAKPDLGLKRQCVACGTRFYDLMRAPAVCPKCGTEQPAELPRARRPGGAAAAAEAKARKPVPVAEPALEDAEVEGVVEAEDEDEEVLEDTSDLEDGDADLAGDIAVDEPRDEEER
jgi:uncharacterized protein (TIGR02300 family)